MVQDAKYRTLQEPTRNIAYLACGAARRRAIGEQSQSRRGGPRAVSDRSGRRDPGAARGVDRRVPVRIESVADRVRESTLNERMIAALAAGLGGIALLLASAGLYGLLAYAVSRHAGRSACASRSAEPRSVLWMVQRESLVLAAVGIAAGLGRRSRSAASSRTLLFEVTPADPAGADRGQPGHAAGRIGGRVLPARRAASVNPVVALKRDTNRP